MLRSHHVKLLQAKRSVVQVAQDNTAGRPVGAVHTLIVAQQVVSAQVGIRVALIHVLASVAVYNLKLQSARFYLAIPAVLDALPGSGNVIHIQPPSLESPSPAFFYACGEVRCIPAIFVRVAG
jgi:hypothetical protein